MRFSLRLNNDLTLHEYTTLAQAAEAAGFDQFWVSNDLFLRSALALLPAIAQATTRLEVGTGILNPYTMHPAEMAMYAATMDELSGCRFNLGLAAGARDFLQWVGLEQSAPLATVRETVQAVRRLLAGETVEMEGRALRWNDEAYLRFRAPRDADLCRRDGAEDASTVRRGGGRALPLLFPPEHYFGVLPHIEAGMAQRPRIARPAGLGGVHLGVALG